jgi:hypothetical protein
LKLIDLLNASFASGELPGTEGMVDVDRAREMGYLVGTSPSPDEASGAESSSPSEDETPLLSCPVVVVTRSEDVGDMAYVNETWYCAGGEELGPLVTSSALSPGVFAVLIPAESVLPDEPEFVGMRRYRKDVLLPFHDAAAIVARHLPPEIAMGDDQFEFARYVEEALLETVALGDDFSQPLGIRPGKETADG